MIKLLLLLYIIDAFMICREWNGANILMMIIVMLSSQINRTTGRQKNHNLFIWSIRFLLLFENVMKFSALGEIICGMCVLWKQAANN